MDTTSSSNMVHRRPICTDATQSKLRAATGLPPKEALIQLFSEEGTILSVSKRVGLNRNAIYQALSFYGVELPKYDQSSHMRSWYKSQPSGTGERLTKKAHDAVRGIRRSHTELLKRARHDEEAQRLSKGEAVVVKALSKAGIDNCPQMAIDIFNIDIALPKFQIAIEVNGGNWHTTPKKADQDETKYKYLHRKGWKVVYLWGNLKHIQHGINLLIAILQQNSIDLPEQLHWRFSRFQPPLQGDPG